MAVEALPLLHPSLPLPLRVSPILLLLLLSPHFLPPPQAFDQLLLVQKGGMISYFGPLGVNSSSLVAYMSQVPGGFREGSQGVVGAVRARVGGVSRLL